MTILLIVESPGKTRVIEKYLGPGYQVLASVGHIRDLPSKKDQVPEALRGTPSGDMGVNLETWEALYVISPGKEDVVRRLQQAARTASEVYIATDGDREGESIGWHVARVCKLKDPKRIVFTSITKEAVQAALGQPRRLDMNLVSAQEARRIIDRVVGFSLSPLLWRNVQKKTDAGTYLSAGRVQSAAQMLIAGRDMSRMRFLPANFWVLKADTGTQPSFVATVTTIRSREFPAGRKLAGGGDYGPDGKLKPDAEVMILSAQTAQAIADHLNAHPATVADVERSAVSVKPPAPLITSSLQQAAKSVGLNIASVMKVAQELYEGGYITYMRTDSVSLSDEALVAARAEAVRLFGPDAVPPKPRQYATHDKSAQEAHEAIRPTGAAFRAPDALSLSDDQLRVYTLIYQRTVASQMHDAQYEKTVVTLKVPAADLRAQGRVVVSPGWTALTRDRPDDESQALPALTVGEKVKLRARAPEHKKTNAPPRFTEATLVQALKQAGIGRPSTYEALITGLQKRGFAVQLGGQFAITAIGLLTTTYLSRQVPDLLARTFTASMERELDEVAAGRVRRTDYLHKFWTNGLAPVVAQAEASMPDLALPHLEDTRLRSTPAGPRLHHAGREASLPTACVPADLSQKDVSAILAGTWVAPVHARAPRQSRAAKAGTEGGRSAPFKERARSAGKASAGKSGAAGKTGSGSKRASSSSKAGTASKTGTKRAASPRKSSAPKR